MDASTLIDLLGGTYAVAKRLGIRPPSVSEWKRNGAIPRNRLIQLAADIETATKGDIRRWHLFPGDWYRIWPELVGVDGAPDAASQQSARRPGDEDRVEQIAVAFERRNLCGTKADRSDAAAGANHAA